MVYFGRIRNGRVELDSQEGLREGARVRVEPVEDPAPAQSNGSPDPVYRLGDDAIHTGIPDLSVEHDHYAYGVPKRSEPKDA